MTDTHTYECYTCGQKYTPKEGFKNRKYYCDEKCEDNYHSGGRKPKLSIEQMQKRLLDMGDNADKHPFEVEMEEKHKTGEIFDEIFGDLKA